MGKHKKTEERDKQNLKDYISNLVGNNENKFMIENCLTDNGDGTFEIDPEKLRAERDRVYK